MRSTVPGVVPVAARLPPWPSFGLALLLTFVASVLADRYLPLPSSSTIHQWFTSLVSALGAYRAFAFFLATLAAGYGTYWFKNWNQLWYGRVEVFLACVSAVVASRSLEPADSPEKILAVLAGAIYFIVRGLSNIAEAVDRKPHPSAEKTKPAAVLLNPQPHRSI